MIKSVALFVENTLKPLIEQLDEALSKCKSLDIQKSDIKEILDKLIRHEEKKVILYSITSIILSVCFLISLYYIFTG